MLPGGIVSNHIALLLTADCGTRLLCSCRPQEERVEHKEFLYLPKPNHLVYIKPTVAVVADVASRASVGLKMTIGNNQLERYVIEYYSKRL